MRSILTLLLILVFSACSNTDVSLCCDIPNSLSGTWQLYERGYSEGQDYTTEEIAADPAQTLQLSDHYEVSSNITSFQDFENYSILTDTLTTNDYLFFYNSDDEEEASYDFSYSEKGDLLLYYRFCVEGCHLAFVRIE